MLLWIHSDLWVHGAIFAPELSIVFGLEPSSAWSVICYRFAMTRVAEEDSKELVWEPTNGRWQWYGEIPTNCKKECLFIVKAPGLCFQGRGVAEGEFEIFRTTGLETTWFGKNDHNDHNDHIGTKLWLHDSLGSSSIEPKICDWWD